MEGIGTICPLHVQGQPPRIYGRDVCLPSILDMEMLPHSEVMGLNPYKEELVVSLSEAWAGMSRRLRKCSQSLK